MTLKTLALFLALGFLTACSSSGKLVVTQALSEPIAHDKTVALSVKPDVPNPEPVHTEVATRVRAALFGRLVSDRVFKDVVHSPDPAEYAMDVRVSGARQVSTGARIFLGVMAGANNLKLDVSIRDLKTQQIVTVFQVEGHSASHPFSSEAGLDDAIREAIEKVVDTLG